MEIKIPKDDQWINFTHNVFNYYNGKINRFNNNAILDINMAADKVNNRAGYSKNPNIVCINLRHIINKSYEFNYDNVIEHVMQLQYMIIQVVIHELFHLDQIIDYYKYNNDPNYCEVIENATEFMTNTYIASHVNSIYSLFRVELDFNNLSKLCNPYKGFYYRRKDINTHILSVLSDIVNITSYDIKFINILSKILYSNNGIVNLVIEDESYNLKNGINYINLHAFNKIIYEKFYLYNLKSYFTKYTWYDNSITIYIDHLKMKKNMVTI